MPPKNTPRKVSAIAKCQICRRAVAEWTWQPFGPSDDFTCAFTALGSHYRGFPAVKTCENCRQQIKTERVIFTYRHNGYVTNPATGAIEEAPF